MASNTAAAKQQGDECGGIDTRLSDTDEILRLVNAQVEREHEAYASPEDTTASFPREVILDALQRNEDGDAWLFVELHRCQFCYDTAAGRWYKFGPHHWQPDYKNDAMRSIDAVVDVYAHAAAAQEAWLRLKAEKAEKTDEAKRHEIIEKNLLKRIRELQSLHRKEHVLELARTGSDSLAIVGDEWDRNVWLLAVINGVIDLKTGKLRDGKPEDYIKTVAPTEYHGLHVTPKLWINVLDEVFPDGQDIIGFMQRGSGYALIGQVILHVFFILIGLGRNGKTTIMEIISFVLGPYVVAIDNEMLMEQKRSSGSGRPRSDLMALQGARIAYASETSDGQSFNTGVVKWLTGGGTITARGILQKRQINFSPSHSLFLDTNTLPHVKADDYAFWKRAYVIKFTESFVADPTERHEHKENPYLIDELKAEAPGILAWLVSGCLAFQEQGLNPPESVKLETAGYRKSEDILGRFISERCVVGETKVAKAGTVFKAYLEWCETLGHKAENQTNFGKQMRLRFDTIQNHLGVHYTGVGIIDMPLADQSE